MGHSPARFTRFEAQLALQCQTVDLVNHAVNFIRQRGALGAQTLMKRYQFRSTCRNTDLGGDRKTP